MELVFVLLVVTGAIFVWAAARGWLRGSVQNHDRRARESMKLALDALESGDTQGPTWANDNAQMNTFTYAMRKLMDRAGISDETRRRLFANEETQKYFMAYAAQMERDGASFVQQQLGAGEMAIKMAQALERRETNASLAIVDEDKEETIEETSELKERLSSSLEALAKFLEMYDQLEVRRREYYTAGVGVIYDTFVKGFGDMEGYKAASLDLQLRFLAGMTPKEEDAKRHTKDAQYVFKWCRIFVSSVLILTREQDNFFVLEDEQQALRTLSDGADRFVQIGLKARGKDV